MARTAEDRDRLLENGVVPINKIRRLRDDQPLAGTIGEHTFTLPDGSTRTLRIDTVDGAPGIGVAVDGQPYFVLLSRQRLKWRGNVLYARMNVPDVEPVRRDLRGATVWIRYNSTPDEIAIGQRRTRHLRVLTENDPTFGPLYGVREDTESTHNHIKQRLWGRRARTVGLARQSLNMLGYQLATNLIAAIAYAQRTGEDLSEIWGEYRPPGRPSLAAAA